MSDEFTARQVEAAVDRIAARNHDPERLAAGIAEEAARESPATLSDQLRAIVAGCGLSLYEIRRRCGVDHAVLSRFLHGGSLTTANVDRLAPLLGLKIRATKRPRPAKRAAK